MHLRRQRYQQGQASHGQNSQQEGQDAALAAPLLKEEPAFQWEKSDLPKEVRDLAASRKVLRKKIHEIENRLRFGYSAPLNEYKMILVKEDIQLSCKMTDLLIACSN